ncbi:hypothetical protein J3E71DRAFT_383581 [Bipolaris maydis]|nr:hypothetical protein J3E71DRAFT_383581 [Bipolaris maydis]
MLLLARRVARVSFAEDQERLWWHRVQKLLPGVIFTSSVTAVQALMLAALHLHNTNHRDACWNLTGAAIRIAHHWPAPGQRERRQHAPRQGDAPHAVISSYDRPSAMEMAGAKLRYPSDKIINGSPGILAAYCRLTALLGTPNASDEAYVGPLSPAASVLRDLGRWKETLPQHLQPEAIDATHPPADGVWLRCTVSITTP